MASQIFKRFAITQMKHSSGKVHHVSTAGQGQTIAAFLREQIEGASWSQVQKMVRMRHVMIHGNICTDVARRLKEGEVVKILAVAAVAPPQANDVRIVHLDDQVVVVDKPTGVTTTRHTEELSWSPRRRQVQPTLDEMVPETVKQFVSHNGGGKKPRRAPPVRAVHRIDRETSGLVVFARTVPAERILAEQFRAHTTHRRYLAICVGRVGAGTIQTHLVRDRGDGRRGSSTVQEGKYAVTHVKPVEHFGDAYTLVECQLETGRTHQIRIHMAETGHPVCGERVYSAPRGVQAFDDSGAGRVLLHATELGFVHPVSGETLRFSSPLPADMQAVLHSLGSAFGSVGGTHAQTPASQRADQGRRDAVEKPARAMPKASRSPPPHRRRESKGSAKPGGRRRRE